MHLVSFWYWLWLNSLSSLHSADSFAIFVFDTEIGFANPLFSWFRRFICTFLFPGQSLLGQPLFPRFPTFIYPSSFLIFVFSNHSFFFFSSGVWVKDFYFLLICCVWFLLFLKGKCSIFGLSWTFCKSSSLSLTKTPLISKGTNPICKQEMFKYDTRFSIPSMVSKVHFPNEWGIPCKSLEWTSKILKLCSELLITATVFIPIINKQHL